MIVYGIPNCDTVAKARKFLAEHQIEHHFHDVRADGLETAIVEQAFQALGDKVFNTRSPSWRGLSEDDKNALKSGQDFSAAIASPTVLKRPLVFQDQHIFNGFNAQDWAQHFNLV